MKTYAGIDLHSNNSYIVIIDSNEKVLFSKRIANVLEMFLTIFQEHKDTLVKVVIESTYNWYWLADGLHAAGYQVALAMPNKITQYRGLKYTNDKSDAHWLARLLSLNLIESGYIMPPALRSQRECIRKRMQVVRQQTQTIVRLQSMLTRYYSISLNSDKIKRLTTDDLSNYIKDENILQCAICLHGVLKTQMEMIAELEKISLSIVKKSDDFLRLKAIPGIGNVLASVILLETGEISRFKGPGNYVSYCRLVRSERISNNKKKGENNRKNGNPYLCWAFIEAANYGIRYNEAMRRFYQRKLKKNNAVLARVAVAHKLARAVYHVLKDNVPFDLNRAFKGNLVGNV